MTNQHLDRMAEVMATAGVWARINEMKSVPLAEIKLEKQAKEKTHEAKRKDQKVSIKSVSVAPNLPGNLPPAPPTLPPISPGSL